MFYEGYDDSDEADFCKTCGEWGVAESPLLASS